MSSLGDRVSALLRLGDTIDGLRHHLTAEIVRTRKQPLRVAAGDVDLAVRRLRGLSEVTPLLEGREPVGTVAVMFASNAALSNPVSTIGTAFLAGNRVIARFPRASTEWMSVIAPILSDHLEHLAVEDRDGRDFLRAVAHDPAVATVIVFGDDSWASGYREVMRDTRTKLIFEGGGSDPFLVLHDADVEAAARDAVRGGFYNAGQVCTSPERVYVDRSVHDRFVKRVVELTQTVVTGDPESPETTVGPITSARVADRIERQLREAVDRGARVLVGGSIERGRLDDGTSVAWVRPTVLTGVHSDMAIMQEETFGPVLPVQPVTSNGEAIALAGDSDYGLSATIYGGRTEDVRELSKTHGQVFHNEIWLDQNRRVLHPAYGGRKRSGWVWAWECGLFVRREGPRRNALEFTRPVSPKPATLNLEVATSAL